MTRFLYEIYNLGPKTELSIEACLVYGEDLIDILKPPFRRRASENLCYSDSLGSMILSLKTLVASNLQDALLVICLIWRTVATFSVESMSPLSPCHTIITMKSLNPKTATYTTLRFIELSGLPSTYTLKQRLPTAVDRFSGRAKYNRSAIMLRELAKESISNAQPNPRKKKKAKPQLNVESSVLSYLLQDNLFHNPCCYVVGCIRPVLEHRDTNCTFLDFLQKISQLLPIKNPKPEAYEREILTKIPSFSEDFTEVLKYPHGTGLSTACEPRDLSKHLLCKPQLHTLAPLVEKIEQEIRNTETLRSHCRELVIFEREVELNVYDGIIIKDEGLNARDEKKKKKKKEMNVEAAALKPVKKKGYKERERELKERAEKESLNRLIMAEENRKKEKVSLMKDVADLFFRKIALSDYLIFARKYDALSRISKELASVSCNPQNSEQIEAISVVEDARDLMSWLGRKVPLSLATFRQATEYIMEKSWVPPSTYVRTEIIEAVESKEYDAEHSDSEISFEDQAVAEETKPLNSTVEDVGFPPPYFSPLDVADVIGYTSSVVEPHLLFLAPNNCYGFDKLTYPIEVGYTVVTGISTDLFDWKYEDRAQRNSSELAIRELLDTATTTANSRLLPLSQLPSDCNDVPSDSGSLMNRTQSKFSMISDTDEGDIDPLHKILNNEEKRVLDHRKGDYTDSVEVFLAGMKTLGLFDVDSLRESSLDAGTSMAKDIHVMTVPSDGVEPLHCIFSRFGRKVRLQVYVGAPLEHSSGSASRPGTAPSEHLSTSEESEKRRYIGNEDVCTTASQAALLPLVWINGKPLTSFSVSESASDVAGVEIKGKKKTVPSTVVLNDQDILRIGVATYLKVVIPEEIHDDKIIAGQDQSFKLDDIVGASRGTSPSQRAESKGATPVGRTEKQNELLTSGNSLTEWEQAVSASYCAEALIAIFRETELQRRHFLHLSVNRELAQIVKTSEKNALMSMLSFQPNDDEVKDMLQGVELNLKAQLCDLLAAV